MYAHFSSVTRTCVCVRASHINSAASLRLLSKHLVSAMPDVNVEATELPAKIAPVDSATIAINDACLSVMDLAPTLGAHELATSLAPMPESGKDCRKGTENEDPLVLLEFITHGDDRSVSSCSRGGAKRVKSGFGDP